ncbi:MAG TPA: cation:proton antiporter [Haliangium sp.]|nr:cation:proton antiporter [Haliangium sp.]
MHEARTFLQDLALVCCVAAVVAVIFRRLRQPEALGYLLAGIIVGPHVPIPLFVDSARIHDLSELGVILVMFAIGIELSVGRFLRVLPTAGLAGLIQIGGMLWLGYIVGRLFGWTWQESLFAGALVSISSTMIVASTFAEQKVEPRLSELAFGILIVEDLAAVLLITLLTAITTGSGVSADMLLGTTGRLALFVLALLVGGFLVVPRAIRAVSRLDSPATLLVSSVGLCFGLALLAQKLGYSVALGAFIAGSLVAESGRARQVEHLIVPLRDLFSAVFFVSVGMMVDPAVLLDQWAVILVLTVIVLAGKIWFVALGSFLSGAGIRTSVRAGMSLAQIGEFSFIIAGVGVASGAVGGFLYGVAVAVAVITTFTTPWMVRVSERAALLVERRLPGPLQTFATLYGAWLVALRRSPGEPRRGSRVRRLAGMLVVDGAAITAIIVGVALAWPRLADMLSEHLGLPQLVALPAIVAGALLAAVPFALGVLRCARKLGVLLATSALPAQEPGKVDLAAAPRKALILALQLSIILLVGIPILAVTQPFLPLFYGLPILLVVVTALGIGLWRSTANLEGHVRAGAQVVIELLRRQSEAEEPALDELEKLLPGLGPMEAQRLAGDSPAAGKTLAELNLRGKTGAAVLAILRHDGGAVIPTGHEPLAPGDVLALTGTAEAVASARALLAGGTASDAAPGTTRGTASDAAPGAAQDSE